MGKPLRFFVDDRRPIPVGYNKLFRDGGESIGLSKRQS